MQVSGRVVYGVSPWVIDDQVVYIIVCHRFGGYNAAWGVYVGGQRACVAGPSVYRSQGCHRLCMCVCVSWFGFIWFLRYVAG